MKKIFLMMVLAVGIIFNAENTNAKTITITYTVGKYCWYDGTSCKITTEVGMRVKIDDNSVPPPPDGLEQVLVKSDKLDMKQQNLSARTFTREETGTNL